MFGPSGIVDPTKKDCGEKAIVCTVKAAPVSAYAKTHPHRSCSVCLMTSKMGMNHHSHGRIGFRVILDDDTINKTSCEKGIFYCHQLQQVLH